MDNVKVGIYMQGIGIGMGAIATLINVTRHPILTSMLVVGAGLYFLGEYIKKNR